MYFLTKGSVKVVMDNKVMAILKEGDYFGEVALIKNVKRTASVLSTEYCAVYVLNKQDFNEILSIYPEFAEEIKQRAANYSKEYESEDL